MLDYIIIGLLSIDIGLHIYTFILIKKRILIQEDTALKKLSGNGAIATQWITEMNKLDPKSEKFRAYEKRLIEIGARHEYGDQH